MNNCLKFKVLYTVSFILFNIVIFSISRGQGTTDSLNKALTKVKSDTEKVNIYLALSARAQYSDSDTKKGYAIKALQLAEKIKWDKGIIAANHVLSYTCKMCSNDYESAIAYSLKAAALAKENRDKPNEVSALNNIGLMYREMSQYSKAIEYYQQALSLNDDPNFELSILGNMGTIYSEIGDYPRALTCYDSSLTKLETIMRTSKDVGLPDTLQKALLIITIGDVHCNIGSSKTALAYYESALRLVEHVQDKYVMVHGLIGIATAHKNQHDINKANEYYLKALQACPDVKDLYTRKHNEAAIANQLAAIYLEKGEMNTAIAYAEQSTQIAEAGNYLDILPLSYITLGKIYTWNNKYSKAIDYLKSAVTIAQETGALVQLHNAYDALSLAYEHSKQPSLALDAYRQSRAIQDSLFTISKTNEINRLELKRDYNNKHYADSVTQAANYRLRIQKQQVFTYSGFAGLVVALLLAFFIYRNYSHQRKANVLISKAKDAVDEEKEKAEALLLNILPVDVANELKQHGDVQPKVFDNVTVLFTDFVGFTVAGDRLTPQQLVAELHACFKAFDVIIGKYKIEKIKTVGDAYLAVSGLPQANDNHAEDIVKAALEIRDFMVERRRQIPEDTFEIRLGINSGPVVAGIVGVRKFAYDIWGDTVNVAARMEQYSQEGKVNISEKTYALVKDKFHCTDRGVLNVKNKGQMNMYFVEAIS